MNRSGKMHLPTFWSMLDAETQAFLSIAGVKIQGVYNAPYALITINGFAWVMYLPEPQAPENMYSLGYWQDCVRRALDQPRRHLIVPGNY